MKYLRASKIERKTPLLCISAAQPAAKPAPIVPAPAHLGQNGSANKTSIFYHMQTKNDRDFFLVNIWITDKVPRSDKKQDSTDSGKRLDFMSNFCYNENNWEVSV